MFPACLVFGVLGIIQIQCIDFTNQEGFNTGFVTLLSYAIRLFGYLQLLCLIIEMLYQQEYVLVEVDLFLPYLRKYYIPIAFRYPYLSASLSPVQNRNLNAYLHNLIILQVPVDTGKFTTLSRISYTGKQINATQITTCRSYRIIGLQLTATNILGKRITFQRFIQNHIIFHFTTIYRLGNDRTEDFILSHSQKGTKLEHLGIQITFGFGQRSLCIQCRKF